MPRKLITALLALYVVLYIALNMHVYNGLNKGLVIDLQPSTYSVGLEVVGETGLFVCDLDC